ncbi:MAG: succinyldiaminopimelate transaminase [Magnetococcales bacterium]|nr:succinyldiaminopimelate transaminase [Magnetococcales bacterium]
MNPRLNHLEPYPFEKLAVLLANTTAETNLKPINLSIGEPKHPPAPFLLDAMRDALSEVSKYPSTAGMPELRQAACQWAEKRYALDAGALDPERNLLPVNGTREALFSIVQAVVDPAPKNRPKPVVLMPNPFYQIYEGAAIMANAEPVYMNASEAEGFLPDFGALPPSLLDRVQLLYLCTPSNPTGAAFSLERLQTLIQLADRHDFVIVSDECYSEIWYQIPPPGILEAAWRAGRRDFSRCLSFQSLSKRSNLPGARSGFVAGDAAILKKYLQLRTYTGCSTPPFIQRAAIAAWLDEAHVETNRVIYRQKLAEALEILAPVLPVKAPDAGFYLWLKVPGGGERFAHRLYERYNVTVLPGAYLSRSTGLSTHPSAAGNPGEACVRVAMVASVEENREAMQRIAACARELQAGN